MAEDCRECALWERCPCGKAGHENGTSVGYSIGECKMYDPIEIARQYAPKFDKPVVDMVEVVRCKDCKWYCDYSEYCDKWGDVFVYWSDHSPVPPNGFCFMGERREK